MIWSILCGLFVPLIEIQPTKFNPLTRLWDSLNLGWKFCIPSNNNASNQIQSLTSILILLVWYLSNNGGSITLPDNSATNEIQSLSSAMLYWSYFSQMVVEVSLPDTSVVARYGNGFTTRFLFQSIWYTQRRYYSLLFMISYWGHLLIHWLINSCNWNSMGFRCTF